MFLAVSARVSPFVVLLVEAVMLKVSALILLAAISKDRRVLVLGSKKRVTTVLPRRTGTFFMALAEISLKDSAVLRMCSISGTDRGSRPRMCLWAKRYSLLRLGLYSCRISYI